MRTSSAATRRSGPNDFSHVENRSGWVTETLPAGVNYVGSWLELPNSEEWEPLTPTVGAGTVVWDLGALENGEYGR